MEPCKESFHLPSSSVSSERAAILCWSLFSVSHQPMRRDQFDPSGFFQADIQRVAVIGFVSDQPLWISPCEPMMQGFVDEGHFMRRSASNPQCDRKAMALRNCHDLAPFASLCFTNSSAPFFALEKEPSMNVSLRSIPPRSCKSATMVRRMCFKVPSLTHSPNRRWQVWYGGNSLGKSFQRAPVRNIQRIPSNTGRLSRRGRPTRPLPLFPSDKSGEITAHWASFNSMGTSSSMRCSPKVFKSLTMVQI